MSNALFIALSTGQNIANLLPILELAEPQDAVFWIESATARKYGWSEGALDVLRRFGEIRVQVTQLEDDEPASIYALLCGHPQLAGASNVRLVGNGGTKLQMLAAFRALGDRVSEVIYNHDQRCVLQRFPDGPFAIPTYHAYRRHVVDLPEMLRCRNREILPNRGERIWPGPPPQLARLGTDADYTAQRHEAHWRWGQLASDQDAPKAIPYRTVRTLVPHQDRRFRESVRLGAGLTEQQPIGDNAAGAIYHAARKLERSAHSAALRHGMMKPPEIGRELEAAVAARLMRWLDSEPAYSAIVQSVWRSVEVRERGRSDKRAELDVALLLRNGVLLCLECKAFDASLKDLDARLGVLQRSSSELARLAVCVPTYREFGVLPWARELKLKAERVAGWRQFRFLPFTLLPVNGAVGAPATVVVSPSFEDALALWLGTFLDIAH